MGTKITAQQPAGARRYATIRNDAGQIWDDVLSVFETMDNASWGDYEVAFAESPTDSGFYTMTFPAAITAGDYHVDIHKPYYQAGDWLDSVVITQEVEWDGSAIATIANINAVTAALTSAAAAKLALSAGTIVTGAAEAGTLSTTQMTTDLTEATNDHFNGRIIIWTSGVLQNQATDVTDYVGVAGLLTFTAVTEAPTAADSFIIV